MLGPGGTLTCVSPGKEAAPPGSTVVARDGEADVRRGAVVPATDLERRDCRSSDGEAVRLHVRLVLRVGRRVRVAREPPAHELAVGRDRVDEVGVDDVCARAAADGVPASVVARGDPVGAPAGVE